MPPISTGGGHCNTGQFFGSSGVIAVISSFIPIFYLPGVKAVISSKDFQSSWYCSGHFAKNPKDSRKTYTKGVLEKYSVLKKDRVE